MRLNSIVAQIISAPNFDHFSTIEVRSAYLALNEDKTIAPSHARRFVYTELIKLVKRGWLRKTVSKKKEITSYTKTELFDPNVLVENNLLFKEPAPEDEIALSNLKQELSDRLNNYRNELLTGLGEVDEYKKICKQFPALQSELQPKYNQVRESNSKLLGSIKAIESLITIDS